MQLPAPAPAGPDRESRRTWSRGRNRRARRAPRRRGPRSACWTGSQVRGLGTRAVDRLAAEVVADEVAPRILARQPVDRASRPTADVEDVDARLSAESGRPDTSGMISCDQRRVDGLSAVLGHHLVESIETLVWNSAALVESTRRSRPRRRRARATYCINTARLFGLASRVRKAACSAGEPVAPLDRVVEHDAADGHRCEPLADVALIATGGRPRGCSLDAAGSRASSSNRPVRCPTLDHQRRSRIVQDLQHAFREGFWSERSRRRSVELACTSFVSPLGSVVCECSDEPKAT